jgi:predicted nucleic acid-binding protein
LRGDENYARRMMGALPWSYFAMALAHIQDAEVVAAAVVQFRRSPKVGFSDCLMLEIARKAGHLPLGTFDRDLGKLEGAAPL